MMKLVVTLAFAASVATHVNANTCESTAIASLLGSDSVTTCSQDCGYSFSSLTAPTESVMKLMCTSTACQGVLSLIESLGLNNCTISGVNLETDLVDPIVTYCSTASTSTPSAATSSSTSSATADIGEVATIEPVVASSGSGSTEDADVGIVEAASNSVDSSLDVDAVFSLSGSTDTSESFSIEPAETDSGSSSASEETTSAPETTTAAPTPSSGSSAAIPLTLASSVFAAIIAAGVALQL